MKVIELGQSAKVISGYAFKSTIFQDDGIPVIKISNIGFGNVRFNSTNTQFVDKEWQGKLDKKYHVTNGDILISLTGSHITQPSSVVGRVALYKKSFNSLLNQRAGKVINIDKEILNPKYLFYLLNSSSVRTNMALMASGAASQANISPKDVESLKLLVPSLKDQKKIAAILSTYDDLIDVNKKHIKLLEDIATELYKEWFVRFRFPNWQNTEFEKGLPKDWKRVAIASLCKEVRTPIKLKNLEENEKYIGSEHLSRRDFCIYEHSTTESVHSDKLKFKKYDILFGKIRPYLHKVCLANFDGICSTDIIVVRPIDRNALFYLLFTISSETFIDLATVSAKGTKMPRADWGFLNRTEISLPPKHILEKFNSTCEPIVEKIFYHLGQIDMLSKFREGLSPRLMSGKLSVADLDINYPPSMQISDEAEKK